jgi:hypothetical protein
MMGAHGYLYDARIRTGGNGIEFEWRIISPTYDATTITTGGDCGSWHGNDRCVRIGIGISRGIGRSRGIGISRGIGMY